MTISCVTHLLIKGKEELIVAWLLTSLLSLPVHLRPLPHPPTSSSFVLSFSFMDLSPRQLHYFKRELLAIQLGNELEHLRRRPDLLSLLESEQPLDEFQVSDLPFLHYVFQHIVAEFPLLKNSRQRSFWSKAHEFLSEVGKIQLNTYVPSKTDASQRRAMTRKLQRTLLLALNVGVKTIQGQEESIKVTPSDLVNESSSSTTTTTTSSGSGGGGKEDHGTAATHQPSDTTTTTSSTEKKKENGLDNVNVITVVSIKSILFLSVSLTHT